MECNPSQPHSDAIHAILSRFGWRACDVRVTPLYPTTGFSGAEIWRISAGQGAYCLRRWPAEHPSRGRVEFIHAVLHHVTRHGLDMVADPLVDHSGQSVFEIGGALWELTRWLPGEADFARCPSPEKLVAAMKTLARFHLAAATFGPVEILLSPTIADRVKQIASLRRGDLKHISDALREENWPALLPLACQFVDLVPLVIDRVAQRLLAASHCPVPLQPCIRDVWHDHVLFTGSQVTGLIDFGAMRVDTVSCDVARLVGSLVADHEAQRRAALSAYESLRPLSAKERELLVALDQSSIVLGGINWLQWIYLDGRSFADRHRVEQRLTGLLNRLRHLANPELRSQQEDE